jgi:hypothetical protein
MYRGTTTQAQQSHGHPSAVIVLFVSFFGFDPLPLFSFLAARFLNRNFMGRSGPERVWLASTPTVE